MKKEYADWIEGYLASHPHGVVGMCAYASNLMMATFPELQLHGGFVKTPLGVDLHYWLTSPEGEIVDPTESQFGKLQPEDYEDGHSIDPLTLLLARGIVIGDRHGRKVADEPSVRGLPVEEGRSSGAVSA